MWSQFELSCRNFNRIMAKRKWYVVTVGRQVGVFKTWSVGLVKLEADVFQVEYLNPGLKCHRW
jgi:hypothetical protein